MLLREISTFSLMYKFLLIFSHFTRKGQRANFSHLQAKFLHFHISHFLPSSQSHSSTGPNPSILSKPLLLPGSPNPIPPNLAPKRQRGNSVSDSVVELDTAETVYFNENISKISDTIYLGTYFVAQKLSVLRNILGMFFNFL